MINLTKYYKKTKKNYQNHINIIIPFLFHLSILLHKLKHCSCSKKYNQLFFIIQKTYHLFHILKNMIKNKQVVGDHAN